MLPCSDFKNHTIFPAIKFKMLEKKEEQDVKYNVCSIYTTPEPKQNISLYPAVKTISSLSYFFNYLENNIDFLLHKTLVVFDIDEVLLHRRRIAYPPIKYIEFLVKGTNNAINELSKYADVICLTARPKYSDPLLPKKYINLLSTYNQINLTNDQQLELNKFSYYYKDNIIYTDQLAKGTALENFYSFSKVPYDKVIFIDDNKNNCLSVVYTLKDYNHNIDIESFNLENPGYNSPCSINLAKYPCKKQAHFHSITNHQASYAMDVSIEDERLDIC